MEIEVPQGSEMKMNPSLDSWVWEDLTDSIMPLSTSSMSDHTTGLGIPYLPNATFGAPFTSSKVSYKAYNNSGSDQSQPLPDSSSLWFMFAYRHSETVHLMYSQYENGSLSKGELLNPRSYYNINYCHLHCKSTTSCLLEPKQLRLSPNH